MKELPKEFIDMLHDLLGDEASDLIKALDESPVTSVRINKRKIGAKFENATPVPWCASGFYLNQRPDFILDPLLHAGAYYVQDASSMVYETVISILIENLKQNSEYTNEGNYNFKVLDLCAAPGGKTTAIINALPDGSFITANEFVTKRYSVLKENLSKWGYQNVITTNKDTAYYASQSENYDIVAVDAPCSGEGMMRKEEIARTQWSKDLISKCSSLQKEILTNAVKTIKPGGYLIYSTCTFNRCENEDNAEWMVKEFNLEPVDLDFPEKWKIHKGIQTELPVYRFMPHKTKGEGLFLAVFRKPGEWKVSKSPFLYFKAEENKTESFPMVDVDKETALAYLRRESIKLNEDAPRGMVMISYKGLPLGPAKNIGSRANNLYPKNWRILKR